MALRIWIELLFVVTLALLINADLTVQSLPSEIRSNYPWNFSKMEYHSAMTDRPTAFSFYHSTTPHHNFNNHQSTLNYGSNSFVGCKKSESIGLTNHAFTNSGIHLGYPWAKKAIGNPSQLPLTQSFTQSSQYWPLRNQNSNIQYQPPGYVSSVAKIDPPEGYKLWTDRY